MASDARICIHSAPRPDSTLRSLRRIEGSAILRVDTLLPAFYLPQYR